MPLLVDFPVISKILSICTFVALTSPSHAKIGVELVTKGFDRPVWAGVPEGVTGKLWVMEQAGRVWIVDEKTGERAAEPFLDIRDDVSRRANEEGLLGLAFAPDFVKSGRFYVNFTDKQRQTRIVRFVSKNRVTTPPDSGEILLQYRQDYDNHNGGWLDFGPDGMLYIGNGDGGNGNDPKQRAQDLNSHLGKLLRIDVSPAKGYQVPRDNPFVATENAKPEIWAYGLRNPWRCSFDRVTGDFWIGDVGQGLWEEINFMPKGEGAGANYGWRLREGDVATPAGGVGGNKPKGAVDPVYVYAHGGSDDQGLSVTGGYVYHGPVPELKNRYVFGDYQNPRIWSFELRRGKATGFKDHTKDLQPENGRINLIASFAEDNSGNLYIIDHTGPIYRIVDR